MDLGIRQALQLALQRATGPHARIAIRCKNGRLVMLRCDFVCYEHHVEGNDDDGRQLTVPYTDIETVEAAEAATGPAVSGPPVL
jgi:hypothetical protein